MIQTKIFIEHDTSMFNCMDRIEDIVNSLIKKNSIKRDDILEYHTKDWSVDEPYGTIYSIKATITWWVEREEK